MKFTVVSAKENIMETTDATEANAYASQFSLINRGATIFFEDEKGDAKATLFYWDGKPDKFETYVEWTRSL